MDLTNTTIGEIVKNDYRTSDVFKKYGIDFCCGGGKSIAAVCEAEQLDASKIIEEVKNILSSAQKGASLPYDEWPLDLLANYIQKIHHKYVEEAIPALTPYLERIASVHGDRHPELFTIKELFKETAGELTQHMKKEELMVFPYITKLVQLKASNTKEWPKPVFGTVEALIEQMEKEHEDEGVRFKKIAELSNNYTIPQDGCNTYLVAFQKLKEFETDLFLHIHLENNILFPKAIALEQSLLSK